MDRGSQFMKLPNLLGLYLPKIALFTFLVLGQIISNPLFSQYKEPIPILLDTLSPDSINIRSSVLFYEQKIADEQIEDIKNEKFSVLGNHLEIRANKHPVWLKFKLINISPDTLNYSLFLERHLLISLYKINDSTSLENGLHKNWKGRASKLRHDYIPLSLLPKDTAIYLVCLNNFFMKRGKISTELHARKFTLGNMYERNQYNKIEIISSIATTAITFFILFYTLAQFISLRDKVFLYYAFYLLIMFLQYLKGLEYLGFISVLFVHFGKANLYLDSILDFSPVFFYAAFILSYLNVDLLSSKSAKYLKWFLYGMFVLLMLNLISLMFGQFELAARLFRLSWVIQLVGSIFFIWILYKRIHLAYTKYILLGTIFLVLGGIISFSSSTIKIYNPDYLLHNPLLPIRIGFLLEIFCFSFTLGLRTRETEQQKKRLHQELVESQFALLKSEIKTLKAQINPHFISNCLTSIKLLIQEERSKEAILYLVRFSRLLRGVVDYSLLQEITLKQELEFSKLYLELEALRMVNSFNYTINYEPKSLNLEGVFIPPFLLQPFLENAIWHGLRRKTRGTKRLTIDIKVNLGAVFCSIDDNGIGRQAATKYSNDRKQSVGISNMENRLELLNQIYKTDLNFQIIDKYDPRGNPAGTKVELTFQSERNFL